MNLYTVPACSSCNNGAAIEDEEFKVLMGFVIGNINGDQDIVINSIAETIGKNKKIANQIFRTKKDGYAYLQGSILEPAIEVTFDGNKFRKVISRIIRGLFYREKGKPLGCKSEIRVRIPQYLKPDFLKKTIKSNGCINPKILNNDTFMYKVRFSEDDRKSIWGMLFFDKYTVFACVEDVA
jgi:hypothetical protein